MLYLLDSSEQPTLSLTAPYGLKYHTSQSVKLISNLGVFVKHLIDHRQPLTRPRLVSRFKDRLLTSLLAILLLLVAIEIIMPSQAFSTNKAFQILSKGRRVVDDAASTPAGSSTPNTASSTAKY